ncbi:MAG: threonine/serine exporter family protein [Eubacteriales bacterium]
MIIQIISAFFATFFFAIIFNISKQHLILCGLTGAIGWSVFLFSKNYFESIVISNFLGALAVSFVSHFLAKNKKTPVTVFLISGIIPLVPGAGMYKTIYYTITKNYSLANYYGIQSLQIAGVISIAIVLLDTFTKLKNKV